MLQQQWNESLGNSGPPLKITLLPYKNIPESGENWDYFLRRNDTPVWLCDWVNADVFFYLSITIETPKKTTGRPKDLSSPRTHWKCSITFRAGPTRDSSAVWLQDAAADAQTGNVLPAVRTSESDISNLELEQEL